MRIWRIIKSWMYVPGELEVLSALGVFPTFTEDTYLYIADKINIALQGLGTDVPKITKAFNCLQNDADFVKLNNAFGFKYEEYIFSRELIIKPHDLIWFLREYLNSNEIRIINQNLKNKGISKLIK